MQIFKLTIIENFIHSEVYQYFDKFKISIQKTKAIFLCKIFYSNFGGFDFRGDFEFLSNYKKKLIKILEISSFRKMLS